MGIRMDGHGIEVGMAAVQWWFTSLMRRNEGARDGVGKMELGSL